VERYYVIEKGLAREDLIVCRGSGATYRLKSGPGNYRYTPVAKIRFVGRPTRLSGSRKLLMKGELQTRRPYHQGTHRAS